MELHGLASIAIRHRRMNAALGAMLLLLPLSASAQGTLEDYRRAATINQRFANLTTGLVSAEAWIGQTNQAVYRVTVPGGSRFVRVDAEQSTKQPAFDHAAVAKSLSSVAGEQYTEITLPFLSISVVENGAAFEGEAGGSRYRCTIATSSCSRVAAATAGGGRGGRGGGRGGGGRSVLWTQDPTTLAFKPVRVRLGIGDGTRTEVSGPDVKEGMEIITGDLTPSAATPQRPANNPLIPNIGGGGRGRGGF